MLAPTIMILAALLALGVDVASSKSHARTYQVRTAVEPVPAPYPGMYGLHPAYSIASDAHRSTQGVAMRSAGLGLWQCV
jgi:hypothetical protein